MSARRAREAEVAVIRPAQPRNRIQAVAGATERRLPGALDVPIEQVEPDPSQPRQDWAHDDGARRIEDLTASIREFGILQPLVVREDGALADGRQRYIVIAGARRRVAAERVGLATVPVIVRGEEAARVRLLQLVENLQRQNLSPLDEARAYQELMDTEGLSPPMLADRLHVSAQHIRDRLRVLGDQILADAVERRQIAASTARTIAQMPEEQRNALRARVASGESVHFGDVTSMRAHMAAAGAVNPRRKGVGRKKQPVVVPTSDQPPSFPRVIPDPERASGRGPGDRETSTMMAIRESAAGVARALDESLHGEHRALVVLALKEFRGTAVEETWWMAVLEHLRERGLTGAR